MPLASPVPSIKAPWNQDKPQYVPTEAPSPVGDAEKGRDEALLALSRRQTLGKMRDMEQAKKSLQAASVFEAVRLIQTLPPGLLQLYLLAEELTQNRKDVLTQFPKIGESVRRTYLFDPKETTSPAAPAPKANPAPRRKTAAIKDK